MKIIVKDNFLDPLLIDYLSGYFLYNVPHTWGQYTDEDKKFYWSLLDIRNPILEYVYLKSQNEIPNINISPTRTYINIQHQGMDGGFHTDDGNITLLLMITPTPNNGGGEFEYKDNNNQIQKIEYKQNRLIIFDADIKHRGLAYKENTPRITLAYKTKIG